MDRPKICNFPPMYRFLTLISKLPLSILYGVSDFLYLIIYYIIRYRRPVVKENLALCFPEKSKAEKKKIAKQFYRNLCDLAIETIKAHNLSYTEIQKRVDIIGLDKIKKCHDNGSPAFIFTGHTGNWEWMLLASTMELNYPIDPVYKPLKNKGVDKFIMEVRSRFGGTPIAKDETVRELVKRRKLQRDVAMVADQLPIQATEKYWAKFLGRDTAFYLGPEQLAKFTKWPVFMNSMRRVKRGHYIAEYKQITVEDGNTSEFPILDGYINLLEKSTRENPSDWLWSHRRWKYPKPMEASTKDHFQKEEIHSR
jgi:Kdo2-lipid IVA lauroyltransferase/acyltransferase